MVRINALCASTGVQNLYLGVQLGFVEDLVDKAAWAFVVSV